MKLSRILIMSKQHNDIIPKQQKENILTADWTHLSPTAAHEIVISAFLSTWLCLFVIDESENYRKWNEETTHSTKQLHSIPE
jgi:hypothetical protein